MAGSIARNISLILVLAFMAAVAYLDGPSLDIVVCCRQGKNPRSY